MSYIDVYMDCMSSSHYAAQPCPKTERYPQTERSPARFSLFPVLLPSDDTIARTATAALTEIRYILRPKQLDQLS